MKKLILTLLTGILISFAAIAQNFSVTVYGYVSMVSGNLILPVQDQPVVISVDSTNFGFTYENTVYTNDNGYYEDIIAMPGYSGYAYVQTMTYDSCLGYYQYNGATIIPGQTFPSLDFLLCNYVNPECQAFFNFYQQDPVDTYTFYFENFSSGNFTESFWSFGDSTFSYEMNPVHTFPGPGTYNVCLTISDGADCNSTYCAIVVVGGSNTGCENYFYYYYSSNDAYTLTFEGYLLNGAEAYAYLWDFGDGTTGSGQTVTHTYTPQGVAMYMVGLTTIMMMPNEPDSCFYTSYQEVWIQNYPGCSAYFTYYPDSLDQNTIYFMDLSTDPNGLPPTAWYWEFGDGSTSQEQNPVHTYADSGYYYACLTIYAGDSCSNTYCEEIYTGIIPPPSGCESFILPMNMYGLTVDFEGYTVSQYPTDYTWEFGDGVTGTGQYVTHTYPSAGMYTVTLNTIDATGCTFQTFTQIWLDSTNTGGCNAMYTYEQTDSTTFTFYGYIYYNNGMIYPDSSALYAWDFGDGTTAEGQTVTHYFQENPAGGYNVCLTVTSAAPDGTVCTATYCENIATVQPLMNIYGYVYLDNILADQAIVHLMTLDTLWQGTIELQSTTLDSMGFYSFGEVPLYNSRMYYVQAELTEGSAYFGEYLPTYHINSLSWEEAMPVLPLENWPVDVYMIAGDPVEYGSGSITGTVSNLGARSSMNDIEVVLMDSDKNPLVYTRSDEQGNFAFQNIALGTYVIHAEIMGVHTIQAEVTLSEQNPAASVEVQVSGDEANVVFGIPEQKIAIETISEIYPNPVNDESRIDITVKEASSIAISVISVTGQQVTADALTLEKGMHTYRLETGMLPQGIYMVRITSEQGDVISRKFMKTR